jgi:Ca-activated chloride channel family protein
MNAKHLLRLATFAFTLLALLTITSLAAPGAFADGLVVIDCPQGPHDIRPLEPDISPPCIWPFPCPTPPSLLPRPRTDCASYLSVKSHNVTVTIDNQVARTHVDEIFVNPSDFQLEGTYIFPLPDDATIGDFAMWVDGKKLEGKVLDRTQARQIYEDIVRRRRDPALLEYIGRNAFQAHIFPIPPHSEKRVEIDYSQVLTVENGLVKYVYPLNTEKFSPDPLANVAVSVSIKSNQALKAIYSPSHPVSVTRSDDYNAAIGYEASNVKPDRDFVLYYSISSSEVGATLLTYKPDQNTDGFFLLLVTPQVKINQEKLVARDVTLVLDTSGSMEGEKIDQARRALKYVLEKLNPEDRFNVITFSTGVVAYASSPQPASVRGDAERFVDQIGAGGSTDIDRALLEALSDADPQRPTIVIFLTDGLPTVGEMDTQTILDNVHRAAGSNIRLFSFGVGDDVNTLLLDSLGEQHRGVSAYVRPGEKIDETVSDFYSKISTPVLSDLSIDWGGMQVSDVYPYPLPDLFAGSQLVIAGRYRGSGPATVTLKGNVNGQTQVFSFEDLSFKGSGGDQFIAPLWATRKIGYLLAQIRLHGENKEATNEIVSLAVRYGIVTPYTSFLIDEGQDVFTPQGLGGAAQDMQKRMAPAAQPTAGAAAVTSSQANRALKEADSAVVDTSGQVKQIGDKAFILRDGVWTDTMFDPSKMTTTKIQFGSDQYFGLLEQHPDWAPFVALGEQVIFVADGTAYQVN